MWFFWMAGGVLNTISAGLFLTDPKVNFQAVVLHMVFAVLCGMICAHKFPRN